MPTPAQPALDASATAAYLDAVVRLSHDAIFQQAASGEITGWSRSAERMFGLASRDMAGQSFLRCVDPRDAATWLGLLERLRAGEVVEGLRLDLRRAGGHAVPASITLAPLRGDDRQIVGSVVIVRDLTEQLWTQQTLAASDERVRRSEALASAGSFVVDVADGSAQWSEGMYVIHHVSPDDFEASLEAHLALVHPDDRETVEAAFDAATAGESIAELDHRILRPDGTTAWVFLAVEPTVDEHGDVVGLSGVCQDVTVRKQADLAIREALAREQEIGEELRRLDALKDGFLATVSHELRTPLTLILGFAAVLRKVSSEHDAYVDPIERSGQDMLRMIERLLDYGRLQAGRVAIDPVDLALAEHVRTCVAQFVPSAEDRTIVVDVPEDLVVQADPDALDRIVGNLVANAVKYSGKGCTVTVSAATEPGAVVISVVDDGPGIPLEHLPQLFERFYQVPGQSVTRRGTGVGLAIVAQYAELHSGSVSVDSEPGKGTAFHVRLPQPVPSAA